MKPGDKIEHICDDCGQMHVEIPNEARPLLEFDGTIIGYYWDCRCLSIMFKSILSKETTWSKKESA